MSKIAFFVLVVMYGHSGHKEIGNYDTYEQCRQAAEIAEEYTWTKCVPVMDDLDDQT